MPEKSIKEQVTERLESQGGISGADIAELTTGGSEEEEKKVEVEEEETVLENDSDDVVLEQAAKGQPFQRLDNAMTEAGKFEGQNLGLMGLSEVEISEADKEAFLDCLIDGGRFEREFSLFNGKVTGRFRSRTTKETTAILGELGRRARKNPDMTDVEYSATLRHCVMAFQVAELNDVEYPVLDGPLKATYDLDTDSATEPKWWKMVEKFDGMSEGLEQAVYSALMDFERVYWTMVQKANDQDFWHPEGSTSG